ncbi:MAG: ABC transporter ATP-binding protein [Ktedonobacteraceae bacterium]|nr:ABC transporter ATP-binding protein [Ktedonobacteraceae bacterium]MBA3822866.1 ABC transporter ATP-binding protein [Ktedonobacterales bacterium]
MAARQQNMWWRIIKLYASYKWHLLSILTLVVFIAFLGLVPSFTVAIIIDRGFLRRDLGTIIIFTLLSFLATLVLSLLNLVQTLLTTRMGQHIMFTLRHRVYHHLLALPLHYYTKTKVGDVLSRFLNDINGVTVMVSSTFLGLFTDFVILIIALTAMFIFNWQLACIALTTVPTFILSTHRIGRQSRALSQESQEAVADLTSFLEETLNISGMLVIKAFGRQHETERRFQRISLRFRDLRLRQVFLGRWTFLGFGLVTAIGPALLYVNGGLQQAGYLPGTITLGEIVAFVALLDRLYTPVVELSSLYVSLQAVRALFERIFALLDEPATIREQASSIPLGAIQGLIQFEHVDFAYEPDERLFEDISFVVQPGQMVALVGPSGVGKTTLTYLIARLYDVHRGRVLIDGVDVRDASLIDLAAHIAMVTQETYLFHMTIGENIAFGRPDATQEEIAAAAKAAALEDVIARLPQKYDTIVGERGYKLSGGEKQRIAIARALLKNPAILILDEATSALDSHSEKAIQGALDALVQQRTTVVIAHRLSTVTAADQIFVLEKGRIVEHGTHTELLQQGGRYLHFFKEQFHEEGTSYAAPS